VSAEFEKLLPVLVNGGVDFILIGGVAGVVRRARHMLSILFTRSRMKTLSVWLLPCGKIDTFEPHTEPFDVERMWEQIEQKITKRSLSCELF